MNKVHKLYETPLNKGLNNCKERAQAIADLWCKGQGAASGIGREYNTVLRTQSGEYYVTNRFDPRVVQWCKETGITPRNI